MVGLHGLNIILQELLNYCVSFVKWMRNSYSVPLIWYRTTFFFYHMIHFTYLLIYVSLFFVVVCQNVCATIFFLLFIKLCDKFHLLFSLYLILNLWLTTYVIYLLVTNFLPNCYYHICRTEWALTPTGMWRLITPSTRAKSTGNSNVISFWHTKTGSLKNA